MKRAQEKLEKLMASSTPVLFYDGDCGLCSQSVQFMLDHEVSPTYRFAALQSPLGQAVQRHFQLETVDSILLVERGKAWVKSDAALRAAAVLRRPGSWLSFLRIVPRAWRDAVYDTIARQRRQISKFLPQTCRVIPKDRFID